jgi:hypothetical protein
MLSCAGSKSDLSVVTSIGEVNYVDSWSIQPSILHLILHPILGRESKKMNQESNSVSTLVSKHIKNRDSLRFDSPTP